MTGNLEKALHSVRKLNEDACFFDAICVNQSDLQERSTKVPRMCDIYEMADGVAVWLGPATAESDTVIELMLENRLRC